jgi:hypothetical protein
MDIGLALGGAVFVERVFGLPGIGGIALQSLARRDLPVIVGVVMFATVAVIVFNLIVDLLYTTIDPRSRLTQTDFEGSGAASPQPTQGRIGRVRGQTLDTPFEDVSPVQAGGAGR